ncbi:MAG: carboxymuconolactone decarboxylase family protein [Deltaproteobacteria bacterium]|nr:carboxymuconolactone decarboxylase family protein [Deltaproteobacteria bacterium]
MPHIRSVPPEQATGELADAYRSVAASRGSVANILQIQSLSPAAMTTHLAMYRAIMFGPSPLSRAEREAVAVAVSVANGCEY